MKKSLLIVALMSMIGVASAIEVGVQGGYVYGGPDRGMYGVTVGEKVGPVGVELSYARSTATANDQNRYGFTGSYDVAKVAGTTIAVKGGLAFLDNQNSANGYVATAGVGASYPITKTVSLTADYRYQAGQKRVEQFNGNTILAGVKVGF